MHHWLSPGYLSEIKASLGPHCPGHVSSAHWSHTAGELDGTCSNGLPHPTGHWPWRRRAVTGLAWVTARPQKALCTPRSWEEAQLLAYRPRGHLAKFSQAPPPRCALLPGGAPDLALHRDCTKQSQSAWWCVRHLTGTCVPSTDCQGCLSSQGCDSWLQCLLPRRDRH